jgi:acetate kinase
MGTRSGDVDPGLLSYLAGPTGLSLARGLAPGREDRKR